MPFHLEGTHTRDQLKESARSVTKRLARSPAEEYYSAHLPRLAGKIMAALVRGLLQRPVRAT